MSKVSPKTAFYLALWNNYKNSQLDESVEDSYIYRYLQKRKDEQAEHITEEDRKNLKGSSRIDAYVYIQSLYIAYNRRKIKKEELVSDLRTLIEEKSNLRSFSGEAQKAEKDPKVLTELRDKLLDRCLRKDIQVFFNDIGYVERMRKDELPSPEKARKNNEILDLYFGFIGENEWNSSIVEKTLSTEKDIDRITDADYITACQRLYEDLLKAEGAEEVFVPLFMDAGSALGIFIIGRETMEIGPTARRKDKDGKDIIVKNPPCAYYLACFAECMAGYYVVDKSEKNTNASFEMSFEIIDTAGEDGLEDLISKYKGMKTSGDDYEHFLLNHIYMAVIGTRNPVFKNYFVGRADKEKAREHHESMKESIVGPRNDQIFKASSMR